jgi:hypothetical protein
MMGKLEAKKNRGRELWGHLLSVAASVGERQFQNPKQRGGDDAGGGGHAQSLARSYKYPSRGFDQHRPPPPSKQCE